MYQVQSPRHNTNESVVGESVVGSEPPYPPSVVSSGIWVHQSGCAGPAIGSMAALVQ